MTRNLYWESDCGHKGTIRTTCQSLGGLVKLSRADHDRRFPKCDMADIERIENANDRAKRLNPQPTREQLGEGFC